MRLVAKRAAIQPNSAAYPTQRSKNVNLFAEFSVASFWLIDASLEGYRHYDRHRAASLGYSAREVLFPQRPKVFSQSNATRRCRQYARLRGKAAAAESPRRPEAGPHHRAYPHRGAVQPDTRPREHERTL